MLNNRMPATDANDNDRMMVLLAYILSPLMPIVILLVESMKTRPYQKYHAVQALGLGIVVWVATIIFSIVTLGFGSCCAPLVWILFIYYGIVAYQGTGTYFEVPMLTKFMKQQKWL